VVSAPLNFSNPHWPSKHSHASDFSPPSPTSLCGLGNCRIVNFSANSAVYGNVRKSEYFCSLFKVCLNSSLWTCFQKLQM
jgi:hypothetical protein